MYKYYFFVLLTCLSLIFLQIIGQQAIELSVKNEKVVDKETKISMFESEVKKELPKPNNLNESTKEKLENLIAGVYDKLESKIAQIKTTKKAAPTNNKVIYQDEPAFYEFQAAKGSIGKNKKGSSISSLVDKSISSSVIDAINRERGTNRVNLNKSKKKSPIVDYVHLLEAATKKDNEVKDQVSIQARSIADLKYISQFEVRSPFLKERFVLSENSEVLVDLSAYSKESEFTVQIASSHQYLKVWTILNKNHPFREIPLLDNDWLYEEFKDVKKQVALTGYIMVKTNPSYVVEIDQEYVRKIFINNKGKKVKNKSESTYILFAGIKPGNTNIVLMENSKNISEKVAFIHEQEVYYYSPDLQRIGVKEFDIYMERLLGKESSPFELKAEKIKAINFDTLIKQDGPGQFQFKLGKRSYPSRYYIEFENNGFNQIIGWLGNNKLVVSGTDYVDQILSDLKLNNIKDVCITQVTLQKPIKDIDYIYKTSNGALIKPESYFYDKDGRYGGLFSKKTNKMFLLGNESGVFDIDITYYDDKKEFLQSYCVRGSHLIEQL